MHINAVQTNVDFRRPQRPFMQKMKTPARSRRMNTTISHPTTGVQFNPSPAVPRTGRSIRIPRHNRSTSSPRKHRSHIRSPRPRTGERQGEDAPHQPQHPTEHRPQQRPASARGASPRCLGLQAGVHPPCITKEKPASLERKEPQQRSVTFPLPLILRLSKDGRRGGPRG